MYNRNPTRSESYNGQSWRIQRGSKLSLWILEEGFVISGILDLSQFTVAGFIIIVAAVIIVVTIIWQVSFNAMSQFQEVFVFMAHRGL